MKQIAALLAMALAALALVACGGSSSNTTTNEETAGGAGAGKEETSEGGKEAEGGSGGSLKVEANPEGNLEFVQKSLTAKAGTDTLEFTNESPVPHDVKIENSKGEEVGGTEIVSEGSESASVELEPGTYTFFCSIPGHRQAGMEGTLTVK
ncbi:MAG: plastocyanin/azurin family copper-binding protein [Solirubrobacterales bacterium]